MALKDIWVDRIDSVDDVAAEDINLVAHSVIENEEKIKELENKEIEITIDAEIRNARICGTPFFSPIGGAIV